MSRILVTKQAVAPAAPATGKATWYVDTAGRLHLIDATGIDNVLNARDVYNFVRNSGFWFAQRQTPGTLTTYNSATVRQICADGWGIINENASAQYRRIDTIAAPESGLQSRFWGEFTKITSTGKVGAFQVIEASSAANLRGRKVRVTAWIKGVIGTPAMRLGLIQLNSAGTADTLPATFISALGANGTDPTLGTNLAYVAPTAGKTGDNCTANGNAYDCTTTTAWQRFSGVFTVPSDCRNLVVGFWTNAGPVATNGFGLAQVSLIDGEETQDWTTQSMQEELDRVQRYYVKTFPIDTAPVQNGGTTNGALNWIIGKAAATALAGQAQWRYPVRMLKSPAVTAYNPGAANAQARRMTGTSAPADQTATALANINEHCVDVTWTGDANGAVGDRCIIHLAADGEL